MTISVAPEMLDYLRENSSGIVLHVRSASADAATLESALRVAATRVAAIRHPEEPTEQYASFVASSATELRADMKDAEAYDGILDAFIAAVVDGLRDANVLDAEILAGPDLDAPPEVRREVPPFELPAAFPMPTAEYSV